MVIEPARKVFPRGGRGGRRFGGRERRRYSPSSSRYCQFNSFLGQDLGTEEKRTTTGQGLVLDLRISPDQGHGIEIIRSDPVGQDRNSEININEIFY